MYKATLGLAVLTSEGKGGRRFASLASQMYQLYGLTRKIDLHVWFSAARLFSPPRSASFFGFSAGRETYEAVRNLRGKHAFCPPYWIVCC